MVDICNTNKPVTTIHATTSSASESMGSNGRWHSFNFTHTLQTYSQDYSLAFVCDNFNHRFTVSR